jgi:hypothetical protein
MASKLAIREVGKNLFHDFVDKHPVKIFVQPYFEISQN